VPENTDSGYVLAAVDFLGDYEFKEWPERVFVTSGETDTVAPLVLYPLRPPTVTGLSAEYDSLKIITRLSWDSLGTDVIAGFNVYRANIDSGGISATPLNPTPIKTNVYYDSNALVDETYIYRVVAVSLNLTEEGEIKNPVTVTAASAYKLVDSIGVGVLKYPQEIKVHHGKIYVANFMENYIMVFDSNYNVTDTIGEGILQYPICIDFDSAGTIYISDEIGVHKLDANGNLIDTIMRSNIVPKYLAVNGNSIFVTISDKIRKYDSNENVLTSFGSFGISGARGMLVSGDSLFVCNLGEGKIDIFDLNGNYLFEWINPFDIEKSVTHISEGKDHNYYVSLFNGLEIKVFNNNRNYLSRIILPKDISTEIRGVCEYNGNILISVDSFIAVYREK
jgi:DNA-binding beta-propeller fold protein YncE